MTVQISIAGLQVRARLHQGRVVTEGGLCPLAEEAAAALIGTTSRFFSMLEGLNCAADLGLIACEGDLVETAGRIASAALFGCSPDDAAHDACHWSNYPTPAVLAVMSHDPLPAVRADVAKAVDTPPAVLGRLLADPAPAVRLTATTTTRLPVDAIVENAQSLTRPMVANILFCAHYRSWSEKAQILTALANHPDEETRFLIEEHRQWLEPPAILTRRQGLMRWARVGRNLACARTACFLEGVRQHPVR